MSLLPKGIIKSTSTNPKSMVIFSQPKVGKTELCSALDNALLIDVENGSNYVDAQKINIIEIARDKNVAPLAVLQQVIQELKTVKRDTGSYPYKYGIIDTVTALEDIVLELANELYRNTPQGRNWQGSDVRTLPQGGGYYYTRLAFSKVIGLLQECFEYFIMLGHVKQRLVDKDGKEMSERSLDLQGKVSSILCSQVDAIGYMFREDNKTIINFQPSESLISGSRCEHLKNKEITVIEQKEDGSLKVSWDEIFLPN